MDIRGIEVTNQLRSAIRAKLLELGVRYDEELPDYILVMVVNKKSRQQMHDDLHLFLEDCTTPFVDWLHDQVLKKLQKVTVAKKKSLREFVPTVVVKQEEERKKKKISTTSFLEDQVVETTLEKSSHKTVKDDKQFHKQNVKSSGPSQKSEISQNIITEKALKASIQESKIEATLLQNVEHNITSKTNEEENKSTTKEVIPQESHSTKIGRTPQCIKVNDTSSRSTKSITETKVDHHKSIHKKSDIEDSKTEDNENRSDSLKKLRSCINKPKITSVVSVKSRLGVVSPRKKFEIYREKPENENRHRQQDKSSEKHRYDSSRNGKIQRNRNVQDERSKRIRDPETRHEPEKTSDIRSRLGTTKDDRVVKIPEPREKPVLNPKIMLPEKHAGTIKDRLGIASNNKYQKDTSKTVQETTNFEYTKCLEQDKDSSTNSKRIKNRLGSVKTSSNFDIAPKQSQSSEDDDCLNIGLEGDLDEDTEAKKNSGIIKSHIIAVNKPVFAKTERKRRKVGEKESKDVESDIEDGVDDAKIPSKVIVTPRPLKPLQPTQKRATQSLLLRAVAEANQSVVTQKNPEPCLLEKKPILKRLKPSTVRDVSQNLSVHLNASKRLVMEKIQVELNTLDVTDTESKPYVPQTVTDEHMGVVMSLFQRSDDKQKFLVTLSGYNNNLSKEKTTSDSEERLEMEVTEDDEFALSTTQNDSYVSSDPEPTGLPITDIENDEDNSLKKRNEENNENCDIENVENSDIIPRKRRKLSPIVYDRPNSKSPEVKSTSARPNTATTNKKPLAENSITTPTDKSRERCRYWPNCTLGNKCAYMHPSVMCSAFPACKFGEKCAYRHPKCKFGLSCTKLGCVFSHPAQQCKYHPFCTKPGCPYSHPTPQTAVVAETTSQRAKFTWRRRD